MNPVIRTLGLAGALAVVAAFSGCASRSLEHFYTVSGPQSTSTSNATPEIAVAPVAIPPLIDRPQFVVRASGHEVSVLEDHRWAEPLARDLTRALVDGLRTSSGGVEVAERDTARARVAPFMLEVTVSELIAGPGPQATLRASWVLRDRPRACVRTGRFAVDVPMQAGFEAIPVAYAVAMSRLATTISETVGRSMSCLESARAQGSEG